MLAGPIEERGYNLAVGDSVWVSTEEGDKECRCTAFPLANWGPRGRGWLTIKVVGVRREDAKTGGLAHAESAEQRRPVESAPVTRGSLWRNATEALR